jgi:hypothetical protein
MTESLRAACTALLTPPGQEGSGRVRYAAAMTLYHAGQIDAEQLEAYRIASPMDGELPLRVMASRGVTLPGAGAVGALLAAAMRHLRALPGEGPAEVLSALATCRAVAPALSANPVVAAHLPAALRATAPAMADAVALAAPWLAWTTYSYPDPRIGPRFPQAHAFAPLASGADAELGVFLIAPRTLYRDHAHAAPELYAPLTGPHRWRFAPDAPFTEGSDPVWNPPHRPHAILAGDVPFLCLYGWTRDISELAYMVPATDWAAHE